MLEGLYFVDFLFSIGILHFFEEMLIYEIRPKEYQ